MKFIKLMKMPLGLHWNSGITDEGIRIGGRAYAG